jgi:hypothetical protein
MIARAKDELAEQIGNAVKDRVNGLAANAQSQMVWGINQTSLAHNFAVAAYHARLDGSGKVELDANGRDYFNNITHSNKLVEEFLDCKSLNDAISAKRGYGVQSYTDGSHAILNFNTGEVVKYQTFDDIPQDISEKLAMFKLVRNGEVYPHLGVKLLDTPQVYYIVDGKTRVEA